MKKRLSGEATAAIAGSPWSSTYILMGLRYPKQIAEIVAREVRTMKESVTYQAILEEGRQEGRQEGQLEAVRNTLLRLGRKHFGGVPDTRIRTKIDAIKDMNRLQELVDRVLDVASWQQLVSQRKR